MQGSLTPTPCTNIFLHPRTIRQLVLQKIKSLPHMLGLYSDTPSLSTDSDRRSESSFSPVEALSLHFPAILFSRIQVLTYIPCLTQAAAYDLYYIPLKRVMSANSSSHRERSIPDFFCSNAPGADGLSQVILRILLRPAGGVHAQRECLHMLTNSSTCAAIFSARILSAIFRWWAPFRPLNG